MSISTGLYPILEIWIANKLQLQLPLAKLDTNFLYYVTKTGRRNKLCKCVSEICAMLRMKGSSTYAKAHTCRKKKAASWMNTMSYSIINRKAEMYRNWNVTVCSECHWSCFPLRSRNVNVCRVSDSRACNIKLPMSKAWITVLSCCPRNISQKGRKRLRRSKKVSYKHWGFRHTYVTLRVYSTVLSSR
jgi:hypothetical protein